MKILELDGKILDNRKYIEKVLYRLRQKRCDWKLSGRPKNAQTLSYLGIDVDVAFDYIYKNLSSDDYISGPEKDRSGKPGDIWVFGLDILEHDCYLKFQDKPNGIIMWISLHIAEYKMIFPFKN